MKFSVYQCSEQGGRDNNEDRVGYAYTRDSAFFVLADGMGGHAHGELAAQMAVETMTKLFTAQATPKLKNPLEFLSRALLAAHHQILNFSYTHGMLDSPRTTVVALVIQDGKAQWVHCGDSRLYWIQNDKVLTRTLDHSYKEQLPLGSKIDSAYIAKMANRNVLFTCLGAPTRPVFAASPPTKLSIGDQLMLCSDGLWSALPEAEMVSILAKKGITAGIPSLVSLALTRSGKGSDNITALGVEWLSPDKASSQEQIYTDTLSLGEFSSTVQDHLIDKELLNFTDQDIEASISEINAAIARATPSVDSFSATPAPSKKK